MTVLTFNTERIKWNFPPTLGGIAQGFNDSGKEFCTANILEHVVREIIQNSLDAMDARYSDRPVVIRMKKMDMERDIINADDLVKHVEESLTTTRNQKNEKGVKFYRNALKVLKKSKIPVLKIIDENTTGLNGDKWDSLVYMEGTPSKDNTASGGSFGIGKNAPYAASALSLVCYSTRYLHKHRIEKFIARCKLVAHENPGKHGEELQHVGFGTSHKFDGKRYPPVLGNLIHDIFRLKNRGTGIFIIGFNGRNWENAARISIASNFFVAIHDKKLSVQVGKNDITHETLNEEYFGNENQKQYYDLYKNSDTPVTISGDFGTFHLKVVIGDEKMENRVAYINRRGMLITAERAFHKNPFAVRIEIGKYTAVVWATDDKTDERVRTMEPPTHESIEYKRIVDPDECSKTRSELQEISDKIKNHINDLLNTNASNESTALTELSDIIPYVSDPKNPEKNDKKTKHMDDTKTDEPIPVKIISIKDNITSVNGIEDLEDESNLYGDGAGAGSGNENNLDKNKKHASISNMENMRIVRHGDILRVAFDSKTGANKFVIYPAGEEEQNEEPIIPTHVNNVGTDTDSIKLDDSAVTVNTKKGARVVLDVPLEKSSQYTGYSIVEYQTRRKK